MEAKRVVARFQALVAATKLAPQKMALAEKQLAVYGYGLNSNDEILKGEKNTTVVVSAKGPRFYTPRTEWQSAVEWLRPRGLCEGLLVREEDLMGHFEVLKTWKPNES
jgi:hypothetical protein